MADHKFPCLMFYLENQACADKFLRFLHENGIIPELIAEHQAGHSYAVATDDLDNALQHTGSKASANSIGRPRAYVTAETIAHEYYEQGLSVSTIMEKYGISRATVHRRLNEAAAKGLHAREYRRRPNATI